MPEQPEDANSSQQIEANGNQKHYAAGQEDRDAQQQIANAQNQSNHSETNESNSIRKFKRGHEDNNPIDAHI